MQKFINHHLLCIGHSLILNNCADEIFLFLHHSNDNCDSPNNEISLAFINKEIPEVNICQVLRL